jgi:hypothetical protein
MTRYEIDKAVEDGETMVCVNQKGYGCKQEKTVDNFNQRMRERKGGNLYWSFERLCRDCQAILAKHWRTAATGDYSGGNNKKAPIDHCGWLAIDKKFFIDLQPPVIDRVKRYVL